MNQRSGMPAGALHSELAHDPDMADIVREFVAELPQRADELEESWRAQRLDQVQRLAHQLKGACGGYGFPTIGSAAAELESTLTAMSSGRPGLGSDALRRQLAALLCLCRSAAA